MANRNRNRDTRHQAFDILSNTQLSQSSQSSEMFVWPRLSPTFRKSQELLRLTGQKMLHDFRVEHLMFVTLTFPELVTSTHQARKHLTSLINNRLRYRYDAYLWVLEPQSNGSVHFHLLVATAEDVHAGTYVRGFERSARYSRAQKHRFMNTALQAEERWLRSVAPRFGFGRVDVQPIYADDPMAVVHYLRKCDWRNRPWPFDEQRYVRWWSCSKNIRAGTLKFGWVSQAARDFRMKLREWTLMILEVAHDDFSRITELEETAFAELKQQVGPTWFWRFRGWLLEHPT